MGTLIDVLILGGGPAGLTAAIYTARARRSTLVAAGPMPGGQISQTGLVENYPGFPEGVSGSDLSNRFRAQAERFGAEFTEASATSVDLRAQPFRVTLGDRVEEARSIIVATGTTQRRLNVPGEDRLAGRGVFSCATCDAILYEGLVVAVVGGGDSAVQEALDLAKYAERVTVIHRCATFKAARVLVEKAEADPRIAFRMESVVEEILGEKRVEGIRVRSKSGQSTVLPADGVLVAIGWDPNTGMFKGQLDMDDAGNITTRGVQTSVPGVFAAGDVSDRVYRQVVTGCASGCAAALESDRYLSG